MAKTKKKPTSKPKNKKAAQKKKYSKPKPSYGLRTDGDTTDSLKITMHRTLYKKDFMVTVPDNSIFHDIMFNPTQNLSVLTTNGTSNLLYHPDAGRLIGLYEKYKCVCVVLKMSRPNTPISYNNANSGATLNNQLATIPWGTKILHTSVEYMPDNQPNSGIESNMTPLQLRQVTSHPGSWREAVDDGKKLFVNHGFKRSCTRVWKPANAYERRWVDNTVGNRELVRGGIHIRFKKEHPVDLDGKTANNSNFNWNQDLAMLEIEATIYMKYKDRV